MPPGRTRGPHIHKWPKPPRRIQTVSFTRIPNQIASAEFATTQDQTYPYCPRLGNGLIPVYVTKYTQTQVSSRRFDSGSFFDGGSGCYIVAALRYQAGRGPCRSCPLSLVRHDVSHLSVLPVLETVLEGAELLQLQITCTRGDVTLVTQLMHNLLRQGASHSHAKCFKGQSLGPPSGVYQEAMTFLPFSEMIVVYLPPSITELEADA